MGQSETHGSNEGEAMLSVLQLEQKQKEHTSPDNKKKPRYYKQGCAEMARIKSYLGQGKYLMPKLHSTIHRAQTMAVFLQEALVPP